MPGPVGVAKWEYAAGSLDARYLRERAVDKSWAPRRCADLIARFNVLHDCLHSQRQPERRFLHR